jgi:hypothetical protein
MTKTLTDGFHDLSGPYEHVEISGGLPVRYSCIGTIEPTYEQEKDILARIEALTGYAVMRAGPWDIADGDPRYADHSADLLAFTKSGG